MNKLFNISQEEKNRILEMHSSVKNIIKEQRLINEDEPEPVKTGEKLTVGIGFDENETKISNQTKKKVKEFLINNLQQSVPTIQKFLTSNYKLPVMFKYTVGTSSTGTPIANVRVAEERKRVLEDIIKEIFTNLGIRADVIYQIMSQSESNYKPSKLNYNFYDASKIKPDDSERFATLEFTPITTRGLEKGELAKSSSLVQSPNIIKKTYVADWWEKLFGGEDEYGSFADENSILKGIKMLGSYSDVEEVNQELYNSKRITLDNWINSKNLSMRTMREICNHLTEIISSRPGSSEYQVDCSRGLNIKGLELVR